MIRSYLRRMFGVALLAAMVLPTGAAAEEENGGAPGSWLSQYVTARALGLGGAFVGTADDASGVVWNPAGLATLVPNEVRFETAQLFEDTYVHALNFAVPGNRLPSFGLSIVTLRSGEFDRRSDVFSTGGMLWSMLTGRKLFQGDNDAATMTNIVHMDIPLPSTGWASSSCRSAGSTRSSTRRSAGTR